MKKQTSEPIPTTRPLRSPYSEEAAEQQMIAMAYDRAKEQLANGTASSQVICHFLKLGSSKEKLEKRILEVQHEQIVAKTRLLEAMQKNDEMFKNALAAMRTYSGKSDGEDVEKF